MAEKKLNIIIPMAGYGKRLRPHTWSKPKPLLSIAGKTVLGHVLDLVQEFSAPENTEIAFIVGYHGDMVQPYMAEFYPKIKTHYFTQKEMKGQSHAIALAEEFLEGPTMIIFVDTIIDSDFSFLSKGEEEAVIWVKEVEDPRRFGVVALDQEGYVNGLIEKPDSMDNRLAVVGYYYFNNGADLKQAIQEQLSSKMITKGEFFIADAIQLMLNKGLKLRPQRVATWLDAGLPETVLETNRHLLAKGSDIAGLKAQTASSVILPPVSIHPEAIIENSSIGPYVSIGKGCHIKNSKIEDSVIDAACTISDSQLKQSILGERVQLIGVKASLNVGDDTSIISD